MIGLEFLNNDADEEEGLGHAGIETFKSAPFSGVARECGQNSADARENDKTVIISFDLMEIDASDLPGLEDYNQVITSCLEKAKAGKSEKEIDFFRQAKRTIDAPKLKILEIADLNTKGLKGPAKPGTPFHSLVKSYGVNVKESEASLGSFGIGKNAVFALSDLQTVFYSTAYIDDETGAKKFLSQGKSILISHAQNGRPKKATGYWGQKEGFQPVSDSSKVPEWLRRADVGTSIFVVGLREEEHWEYRIAASVIENFFCAIHRDQMEFSINGGEILINSNTLDGLFQDPRILSGVEEAGDTEDFQFSRSLYECLKSPDAIEEVKNIDGFGDFAVRILLQESLPKRVGIIRNGMFITDTLDKFGEKFRRFAMYSDFVALVEPRTDEASAYIKRLENPRHDGISADRISDMRKRHETVRVIKEVAKSIREAIRLQAQPTAEGEVALDEMGEFFGDIDKQDRVQDPQAEDTPDTYTYKPAVVQPHKPRAVSPRKPPVPGTEGGAGFQPGTTTGTDGPNVGQGGNLGSGAGGEGKFTFKTPLRLATFRNLIPEGMGPKKRRLLFTPAVSGLATIRIQGAGVYISELLAITQASKATVNSGAVVLDVRQGEKVSIDIEFAEAFSGPIELIGDVEVSNEN